MINAVRNTVLAIANKNNYGYISPQDFNLYCNQAQMDIFEDYFYQYNNWVARTNARTSGTGYADIVKNLEEVIDTFSVTSFLSQPDGPGTSNRYSLPSDYYLINKLYYYPNVLEEGDVTTVSASKLIDSNANFSNVTVGSIVTNSTNNTETYVVNVVSNTELDLATDIFTTLADEYFILQADNVTEVDRVHQKKILLLTSSNLTAPTTQFPAYTMEGSIATIYPSSIRQADRIKAQYIRYPRNPNWTYLTTSGNDPIFNAGASNYQDFELPESDEPNLIAKICQYIGVEIRESDVLQFGLTQEAINTQETS